MTNIDCAALFSAMFPDFFGQEEIRALPEGRVYDEMLLRLSEFEAEKYPVPLPKGVTFGFFSGSPDELKAAVERVDRDWVCCFSGSDRVYCGFVGGKVASFCIVDDMGEFDTRRGKVKVGGPGYVGTLPEYRRRGIGAAMVLGATRILKEDGFDYGYIHYTGIAEWYEKLGYKTVVKWDRNGIVNHAG